jgi:carboxyl-terminal processing protease
MRNEGGVSVGSTVRTDLPPIVKNIPSKPPKGFPDFDPSRPDDTDFQLQQALVVAKAMTLCHCPPLWSEDQQQELDEMPTDQ